MTISADEAKALLDAATPGPWHTMMGWGGVRLGIEADGSSVVVYGTDDDDAGVELDEDARLIAAAPDLAATVIELSERIDKVAFFHPTTHGKPCGICEALGRYDEAWTQGGEQ